MSRFISKEVIEIMFEVDAETPVGFEPSNLVITDPNKLDFDIVELNFLTLMTMEASMQPVLLSDSTKVAAGSQQVDIRGP